MGEMKFEGMDGGYNKNDGLIGEFDTDPAVAMADMEKSLGAVKEIINHPDLSVLVAESKITQMLEHDLGEGAKLGNSKSIRSALAEAARKIEYRKSQLYGTTALHGRSLVSREQEAVFRREAFSIIKAELMKGRAEFIRKTGQPLAGW